MSIPNEKEKQEAVPCGVSTPLLRANEKSSGILPDTALELAALLPDPGSGSLPSLTDKEAEQLGLALRTLSFRPVKYQTVTPQGSINLLYEIALTEKETGLVRWYTGYAGYITGARSDRSSIDPFSRREDSFYWICLFLDFLLLINFPRYRILDIADMKTEHLQDFMDTYCRSTDKRGNLLGRETITACRNAVCRFVYCLAKDQKLKHIVPEDIMTAVTVRGERGTVRCFTYHIRCCFFSRVKGYKYLFRDMPLAIIPRFIREAERHDPELAFAIVLQVCALLREGEICNVRRQDSSFGPGIFFMMDPASSRCRGVRISLLDELPLRSDGVRTGEIKKEREQDVFPGCTQIIETYYRRHLELIKDKNCEKTRPMFLGMRADADGIFRAMTVKRYSQRLQALFRDHVCSSLAHDGNPELRAFAGRIEGHTWGPHSFRHIGTVALLLQGVSDSTVLASYRGDSSEDSARCYLVNKDEIRRLYEHAVQELGGAIYGLQAE